MKCLVNRIRPLLDSIISPWQSSFLPGRGTHDNILLTKEIVHKFRTYKGKKGFMMLKIDLEKAYDKKYWTFLQDTLQRLKFPDSIIKLILFSLNSTTFSIPWNGYIGENFNPE